MNSKVFKAVVGVLVALIVVVGGVLVARSLGIGTGQEATSQDAKEVPAGAIADDPNLPLPPGNGETQIATPGNE